MNQIKICALLVLFALCIHGSSLLMSPCDEGAGFNNNSSGQYLNDSVSYLPQECGTTRYDNINVRIMNGEKAAIGQFPWIARLGKKQRNGEIQFYCGGFLVNKYYAITAAHCIKYGEIIRLGENNLTTEIDCDQFDDCAPPHQDIRIKKIEDAGYSPINFENDFALVELKEPAQFNDYVQPLCLPDSPLPYDFVGEYVTISGWGLTNVLPQILPDNLLYTTAPIIEKGNCSELYEEKLFENQLCIGYNLGKDSCDGDSGGPAIKTTIRNGKRRAYAIAVISYGLTLCGNGPAIYTDVYSFLNWTLPRITKC